MQRHLQFFFVIDINAYGCVFKMRVGLGRHHVERIEQGLHLLSLTYPRDGFSLIPTLLPVGEGL